jgi:hypothetical protein
VVCLQLRLLKTQSGAVIDFEINDTRCLLSYGSRVEPGAKYNHLLAAMMKLPVESVIEIARSELDDLLIGGKTAEKRSAAVLVSLLRNSGTMGSRYNGWTSAFSLARIRQL